MGGVARVGVDTAGGVVLPGPNATVMVNGLPAAVVGCPVAPHGDPPHSTAFLVTGSGSVFVGGLPLVRAGDRASCGHVVTGSGDVLVG